MVEVMRAFCWHQKFVPKGFSALAPGLYICIKSLKMCIKSEFEEIILKLATYEQREKAFLLSSNFCPQWVVCPCPGLYKTHKKMVKNQTLKRFFFKLATNGQSDKETCWHQNFVPKGLSVPALGLYTCIKSFKMFVCVELLRPCQQLRSCRAGQLPINTVPEQA